MKSAIIILLTLVLVIAFGITACKESPDTQKEPGKTPLADKLQQVLDDAVDNPETQFPGALLYVSGPEIGTWSGAAGLADMSNATPMKPGDKFRAGSVIKPFISTVILQLVEEGVFSLDDTMTALLPGDIPGIGHGGDTAGYSCFVYRLPAQEITIAGMVNDFDWETSHVELLLPVLEILIPDGTE